MKTPKEELLGSVTRCDGGELRVYRKLYRGRPYIELSTWSPPNEGARQLRVMNLRRYEVRPLLLALGEACKSLGVTLRPEELGAIQQ